MLAPIIALTLAGACWCADPLSAQDATCVDVPAVGDVSVMWASPVFRTRIPTNRTLFANLNDIALESFAASVEGDTALTADLKDGFNEAFFRVQKQRPLRSPDVDLMRRYMRSATVKYLEAFGLANASAAASGDLFSWASVHKHGSSHLPHVHKATVVSGVLYVSAGDVSEIIFEVTLHRATVASPAHSTFPPAATGRLCSASRIHAAHSRRSETG